MQNKLFHKGFYLDTLKRIKGLSLFSFIASSVYSAISAIIILINYTSALSSKQFFEIEIISFFDMSSMAKMLAVLVAPIMTIYAFSYLFKRNESDFFEMLPIKRETMAFTGIIAVLSVIFASIIGSALIFTIITIPCIGNYYTVDLLNFVLELIAVLLASALGASVTMLAVSVSGTYISAGLTAAVFLIIPRTLMGLFNSTLQMLNPALMEGKIIPFFNSQVNLYYSFLKNDFVARENAWNYIYSLLLCAVVIIIGVILSIRRGSEWVSQSFVGNTPRHVFSVLLALLPATFAIQCLLDFENVGIWGIVLLVISVIVFLVSEKISLSKGEKNRGVFISLITLLMLMLVWFGAIKYTDQTLSSYTPSASEIEYVSIMYDDGGDDWFSELYEEKYRTYEQYVMMRAENIELRDDKIKSIVADALKSDYDDSDYEMTSLAIKVVVDGKATYRKISITSEDYAKIDSALCSNEDYDKLWMNMTDGAMYPQTYIGGVYIYADALGDVLDTMEAEIREYGIDKYRDSIYAEHTIDYTVYYRGEKYTVSVSVYEYMTKTLKKLDEARKKVAENEMAELKSVLESSASSNREMYISVNYYINDTYYYIYVDQTTNTDLNEFTKDLYSIISSSPMEGYYNGVNILVSEDGIFGRSYYYTFAINPDATEEDINAFFVKYGYEPIE